MCTETEYVLYHFIQAKELHLYIMQTAVYSVVHTAVLLTLLKQKFVDR